MVALSFKRRFVSPIEAGLGLQLTFHEVRFQAPKTHTIRARGKRRPPHPGEILQLYYAMRTQHCRLIGVARCTEVLPITMSFGTIGGYIEIAIDGAVLHRSDLDAFAVSDGFDDVADMRRFWIEEHPSIVGSVFDGFLIKWEPVGATGNPSTEGIGRRSRTKETIA